MAPKKASPRPTADSTAGAKLRADLTAVLEFEPHEVALLDEAVRVADSCEGLRKVLDRDGVLVTDRFGRPAPHPALVEHRQQAIALARLVSALRIPEEGAARPQRRTGVRQTYTLRPAK